MMYESWWRMKYSLITGATSGIGKALAYEMAKKGHQLIVTGRSGEVLERLKNELEEAYNIGVQTIQVDFQRQEDLDQLLEMMKPMKGQIEYVVNNAGVGHFGAFLEGDSRRDQEVIDVNITALTYLTRRLFPYLSKGACMMQVASTAAFAPGPYMAVYYASKAYVVSLGLALRHEWKPYGISVSVLCPGSTKTAFIDRAKMQKTKVVERLAMTPEDVAKVAYKGMVKRKALIIPGMMNKLTAGSMDMMPSRLGTWFVSRTQKKK